MRCTCLLNLLYVNPKINLFASSLNPTRTTTGILSKKQESLVSSVWETNSRYGHEKAPNCTLLLSSLYQKNGTVGGRGIT